MSPSGKVVEMVLVKPGVWLLMVVLSSPLASGECIPPNTAVNCSFQTSESCLKAYQYSDEHGLKWFQGVELLRVREYYRSGSYSSRQRQREEILNHYIYIPGSNDPRIQGRWTNVVSPPLTMVNNGCLYFNLRNTACGPVPTSTSGQLNVPPINFKVYLRAKVGDKYISENDVLLQEYPCMNTSHWLFTKLPIVASPGTYKIVFSGKHHEDPEQVVALTNVRFSTLSCSPQVRTTQREQLYNGIA